MEKHSDRRKLEIIEYLNTWLKTQDVFKNREQIADYLHISKSHLGNIITGMRNPSEELLNKIIIMIDFVPNEKEVKNTESDRPFKVLADELQRWYHRQERWKTQKEIAQYLGVDNSYVSKFFMGKMFPVGEIRQRLYTITTIDILKPEEIQSIAAITSRSDMNHSEADSKAIKKELTYIRDVLEKIEKTVNVKSSSNNVTFDKLNSPERIATIFYTLAEEFISFQDSSIQEREKLRRLVSPKDVGFIISFLRAIYDEDKFSDFIFFTKYKLEGGM